MKLLFIVTKLYHGGAELQMRYLIRFGVERGYDIEVIDIETMEKIYENYKVIQLKQNKLLKSKNKIIKFFRRIQIYLTLKNKIKEGKYDYIIFFSILFLPLVFLIKNKIVFSMREYKQSYIKKYNIYLKKIFLITTNNFPSYLELYKNYKNVYFQGNYVENKKNIYKIIEVDIKSYLIISNISSHKNILPVINTFKKLEKRGYKLKIAGKITDVKYYNLLVKAKEGSSNIIFLGSLSYDKLQQEYLKAEGVIHLSKCEGTPNALLDAIKFNKKFICLSTLENMSLFLETPIFMINDESELEEKIYELEKRNYSEELEYLQKKIKKLFSEQNIDEFYKKLENKDRCE